jgi:tetratricopeptide (TPR) repeat protein
MPVSEALPFLDALREQARGDLKVESGILWSKAMLEGMRGRFPEGREMAARSTEILNDLGMQMFALVNYAEAMGFLEVQAGDLMAAERAVRQACDVLEAGGERSWLSTLAADLALILCKQKRFEEAERFVRLSQETAASDDIISQAWCRRARAKILGSEGKLDQAEDLSREAVALVEHVEGSFGRAPALSDLAEILRQAGRPEEALDAFRKALRLYELKEDVVSAERTRRTIEEIAATGRG